MNIVQEERVRRYFIDAAKDLIRGEGLSVVTARNVAERAGYSYATLYNYFKDIRDLIFNCAEDFMTECCTFVMENAKGAKEGSDGLEAVSKNYAKFFVQYPGIFFLLFQQKQTDISTMSSEVAAIHTLFDTLTECEWKELARQTLCNADMLGLARENHKLAVHGLLMLYLNRRKDMDYLQLIDEIVAQTRFATKACGACKP
jgi:AcrR family transcriptional regulator